MSRYQSGYVYEESGAFFVRYYVTEIVDGTPTRVQRSQLKDAKCPASWPKENASRFGTRHIRYLPLREAQIPLRGGTPSRCSNEAK
jgi:hypothetical protein